MNKIREAAEKAITELLAAARLREGDIIVVGCSSSEILGSRIGSVGSLEAAEAVYQGLAPALAEHNLYLAAQCCEHLNRALVIERAAAERYGLEEVNAVPQMHAGGSFATVVYSQLKEPVLVEHLRAVAGLDIGGTLIGMHLKEVAVPVRISIDKIGEAPLILARTRPKYVGGIRAAYNEALE